MMGSGAFKRESKEKDAGERACEASKSVSGASERVSGRVSEQSTSFFTCHWYQSMSFARVNGIKACHLHVSIVTTHAISTCHWSQSMSFARVNGNNACHWHLSLVTKHVIVTCQWHQSMSRVNGIKACHCHVSMVTTHALGTCHW